MITRVCRCSRVFNKHFTLACQVQKRVTVGKTVIRSAYNRDFPIRGTDYRADISAKTRRDRWYRK
ncbi:MAG: hypothetical protein K2W95_01620 [Candidatus Obscuribacterales bacterium]|nr:hypothetical protein [Candidatus Obscuribacterales bacterium]